MNPTADNRAIALREAVFFAPCMGFHTRQLRATTIRTMSAAMTGVTSISRSFGCARRYGRKARPRAHARGAPHSRARETRLPRREPRGELREEEAEEKAPKRRCDLLLNGDPFLGQLEENDRERDD